MSQRLFLSTHVFTSANKRVEAKPVCDVKVIVPSFGDDCGFQIVTITSNGEIGGISDTSACKITAIPVMYISAIQSAADGDMEVDSPVVLNPESFIVAYRTRPFPDGKDTSLVLMSGILDIERPSNSVKYAHVGQLPPVYRPKSKMSFVCSIAGDYVTIDEAGDVIVHVFPGQSNKSLILMDNIRYVAGDPGMSNLVRARFPYRSSIHVLSTNQGRLALSPKNCDLLIPVTVKSNKPNEKPTLSVIAFLQCGDIVPLWDDNSLTCEDLLISSLITSTAAPEDYVTPISILNMDATQEKKVNESVSNKLSAMVYSELVGDEDLKWINRDQKWRQTGIRPVRDE